MCAALNERNVRRNTHDFFLTRALTDLAPPELGLYHRDAADQLHSNVAYLLDRHDSAFPGLITGVAVCCNPNAATPGPRVSCRHPRASQVKSAGPQKNGQKNNTALTQDIRAWRPHLELRWRSQPHNQRSQHLRRKRRCDGVAVCRTLPPYFSRFFKFSPHSPLEIQTCSCVLL